MSFREYKMLEAVCSKCKASTEVNLTDHPKPDSAWPRNWLTLKLQVLDHDLAEKRVYCPDCSGKILDVFGFTSCEALKSFLETQYTLTAKSTNTTADMLSKLLGLAPAEPEPEIPPSNTN